MRNNSKRNWWQLRRVQWPAGVLLTLGLAAGVAIARSSASRVVIYNDSGGDIPELAVSACGQSRTFHNLGQRASVRFKLHATGSASEIAISTNGVAMWRGDYVEPRGGYCATVRLRRDGQVESITTISWWQSFLHPQSNSSI